MNKKRKSKPRSVVKNPEWAVVIDRDGDDSIHLDSIWESRSKAYMRDLELSESGEDRLNISVMTTDALSNLIRKRGLEGKVHSVNSDGDIDDILGDRKYLISNPRTSLVKKALEHEAMRHDNFDAFAERYWLDCSRGIYWYATDKENYSPSERDIKDSAAGRFFVSCNPDVATSGANAIKDYVAEIDVTELDDDDIEVVHSTAGLKISIKDLSKIKVMRTISQSKSLRAWQYQMGLLPSSKEDLHRFYDASIRKASEAARKEAENISKRSLRLERRAERSSRKSERKSISSDRAAARETSHRAKMEDAREKRLQRRESMKAAREDRRAQRSEMQRSRLSREDEKSLSSAEKKLQKKAAKEARAREKAEASDKARELRLKKKIQSERKKSEAYEGVRKRDRASFEKKLESERRKSTPTSEESGPGDIDYGDGRDELMEYPNDNPKSNKKENSNVRLIPKNMNAPILTRS